MRGIGAHPIAQFSMPPQRYADQRMHGEKVDKTSANAFRLPLTSFRSSPVEQCRRYLAATEIRAGPPHTAARVQNCRLERSKDKYLRGGPSA